MFRNFLSEINFSIEAPAQVLILWACGRTLNESKWMIKEVITEINNLKSEIEQNNCKMCMYAIYELKGKAKNL